ncbi:hypothetical protein RUM43_009499 [Polyplax serrata]|uniref:Uncharacterized protein n=1 Tax=Polyplax serrata TaxID=468196 RepID=A0AAN8PD59_POLSC
MKKWKRNYYPRDAGGECKEKKKVGRRIKQPEETGNKVTTTKSIRVIVALVLTRARYSLQLLTKKRAEKKSLPIDVIAKAQNQDGDRKLR